MGNEMSHRRIPLVDIFKGFAMIMVVIVHAEQIIALPSGVDCIAKFGQMGCQIFFLMSGFTLCISNSDGGGILISRIIKLIPAYWTMVIINGILTFLSLWVLGANHFWTSETFLDYIVNLLFLHGFIPSANNNVVLGGWFIGTLVVFYAIFPTLFKLYKSVSVKIRWYLVPLVCIMLSVLTSSIIGYVDNSFAMRNNSFMYFSCINQLPVFILGFVLYDIEVNTYKIKYPMLVGVLLLLCSFVLFYVKVPVLFSIIPVLFGVSVLFIFVGLRKCQINRDNLVVRCLMQFNKYSLHIYLTHSFVVFYVMMFVSKALNLNKIYGLGTIYEMVIYMLLTPMIVCLTYYVGVLYAKCVKLISPIYSPIIKVLTRLS